MRVVITDVGMSDPPTRLIMVDGQQTQVDLSAVAGTLHDPTIQRVEWGFLDKQGRSYGVIFQQDGGLRTFFDQTLLSPYLAAFRLRWAEIEQQQVAFDAAEAEAEA